MSLKPDSLLFKITRSMGDIPLWEAHGTSYGFSSLGIPIPHPGLDSFNQALSAWVDERILSKSDMGALAEYGVDMDHPCVRVYNKEEVDANRRFLIASADRFKMHELVKVGLFRFPLPLPLSDVLTQRASAENIQSGRVQIRVIGKHAGGPEAAIELLKKQMTAVEEKKEELKPQWLREWQDSQRSSEQSAPL